MKNEILDRIVQWSEKTPNAIAIVNADGNRITYQELIDRAKKLALYFQREQLDQKECIAVFLSPCGELSISFLAIWMIGAAYVPIDPIYPKNRILEILQSINAPCVLTNKSFALLLDQENLNLIYIENALSEPLDEIPITRRNRDLAYVIFTSGSTGKPKGVQISFQNLWNVLHTFAKKLDIHANDRLLSITPIAFDIFMLELFLPLLCGATCYFTDRSALLNPDFLLNHLDQDQITIFQATPSTYHFLVEEEWPPLHLRHLLCGGEAWDQKLASQLLKKIPANCTLWNVYGPTETTIWSSLHKVTTEDSIYLSPNVDNTLFYVLDETLLAVEEGELHIAGDGLAIGYYGNMDLTKERFIDNPFHLSFKKMYKTGDLVRRLDEKTFQFIGRKDQQVKIRGFRVELGEIEHALLLHPSISRAIVIHDYFKHLDEKMLVACIQLKENVSSEEDLQNLRQFLSKNLPTYMIPQYFIRFDHLPLTPHLKIDRKKITDHLKQLIPITRNNLAFQPRES